MRFPLLPSAVVLCLLTVACREGSGVGEVVNFADAGMSSQLLYGFHEIEPDGWRWTESKFGVAFKTPRRAASAGAMLFLKASVPKNLLDRHQRVSVTASIEGKPLGSQAITAEGVQELQWKVAPDLLTDVAVATAAFTVEPFVPRGEMEKRELGLIVHQGGLHRAR